MLFHREVAVMTSGGTVLEPGNGYKYHVFVNQGGIENFQIISFSESINI